MQVKSKRHFCLQAIEVILSNFLSFTLGYLKLGKNLLAPRHTFPELIAVKFDYSLGDLSGLFKRVIIVIGKLRVEYLVYVKGAASLDYRGFIPLQNVFDDIPSIQRIGLSGDRVHGVVVVHQVIRLVRSRPDSQFLG